jgi:hypothetical protein
MDAKWEAAIDLTLRRVVYGSLAGGVAGLLLFRALPRHLCPHCRHGQWVTLP